MINVKLNLFPGGFTKALTLSYDDGRDHDRRLIKIMNKHGIKGSFHLNSGFFGKEGYVTAEEVTELYSGHEISGHTSTHPFLETIPREGVVTQIIKDRDELEKLAGYPVRGMSYPFGTYNDEVIQLLPALGMEYSRTVHSHGTFALPKDLLQWHPSCHHKEMLSLGAKFLEASDRPLPSQHMQLLYVWGHSYEFHDRNNWEDIEQFCSMMGNQKEVWKATNIEVADYLSVLKQLRFSVAQQLVYNPSAQDAWILVEGEVCKISGGSTVRLG